MRWMASESMDEARKEKKARRKRPGGMVTLGGGWGGLRQGAPRVQGSQPASWLMSGSSTRAGPVRLFKCRQNESRKPMVLLGAWHASFDDVSVDRLIAAELLMVMLLSLRPAMERSAPWGGEAASNAGHVHSCRNQNA